MKTRFITLLSVPCMLFALACSDSTSSRPELRGSSGLIIVPTGTLDQNILQILALFPTGLETAATVRWGNVKSKYAAGLTDPAQMVTAKQMVFDLSSWVNQKAPNMDTPPNGETRVSTASRAVLYMLMYVYGGPGGTVPPYSPAADAIVGLVTPTAPATIVTPSGHAGVSLDAGSVAENTVIVVSQNLTPYPDNCSGPLQTLVCQYPSFYNFDQFPHVKLLKAAKFSVCHVNGGTARRPLADHDRFRLAHAKPANPADYTPGSTIRDQNGESIEILPLITQTFVTCPPETIIYARADANDGVLSKFAHKIQDVLSPKTAYAIDQGGGGVSFFFSPFNDVDPDGRPDRAVQNLTAAPVCGVPGCLAHPGTHLTVAYSIGNIGTASTGDGAPGLVQLVQPAIEGPPTIFPLGVFQVAQIVPGGSVAFNQDVVIPTNVPPGDYSVRVTMGIGFFNEVPADLLNNTASVPLTIANGTDLGVLPGDGSSVGFAINDAGHAAGSSGQGNSGGTNHAFIWVNGVMSQLPGLGGPNAAGVSINGSDVVAGWATNPALESRAVQWAGGIVSDLGALPGTNQSAATGINSSGQIVGYSWVTGTTNMTQGWIWQNGVMTPLGLLPGGTFVIPTAINDGGTVVGWGDSNLGTVSWTWQNGTMTPVPDPVSGAMAALAINSAGLLAGYAVNLNGEFAFLFTPGAPAVFRALGQLPGDVTGIGQGVSASGWVVGMSIGPAPGRTHAFIWQPNLMTDLGTLGGDFAEAKGINSGGQIIGHSTNSFGKGRATIWVAPPVPPPSPIN